ncbi:hypothetical protein [Streptomyces sp. SID13031]|uniref:hypothetical protein n=1 Tax=Streptomyces sp. SID13031 TaxID=2706046 RepID=UPI0013C9601F|nr:hypothetical protein [Streptomyces sp. SID13031]NEA33625.1 hypothetical protein [Streptomyces sp. SID13031]
MSKFLGFLLGIAVALVGPAIFGVLAADGGIKLNAKEMALAYGIGALIFWAVVSYFSGAAALGAALTFGAMIYTVHWIPNRLTNFLNDVPGVTTGMIDGIKQYTLNGVVPILAVISLVFGIQSIVRTVQRRRRERAEADRLQREQEAAVRAQQMPEPAAAAAYPVAGGDYQPDNRFAGNFGNNNYDDLFEEEPTPFTPRSQADEQTAQFAPATAPMQYSDEQRDDTYDEQADAADETMLVPTDSDETALVPTSDKTVAHGSDADADADADETVVATPPQAAAPALHPQSEVAQSAAPQEDEGEATQPVPVPDPETAKPLAPRVAGGQPGPAAPEAASGVPQSAAPQAAAEAAREQMPVAEPEAPKPSAAFEVDGGEATQPMPVARPEAPKLATPPEAPKAAAPYVGVEDAGEATQPVPVAQPEAPRPSAPQAGLLRKEEVGQQYRERMDPPDVDDTGEFFVGAFENPPEHATQKMELPGQFRT